MRESSSFRSQELYDLFSWVWEDAAQFDLTQEANATHKLCLALNQEFLSWMISCERKCEIWMDDFICIFRGQQTLSLRLFLFHSQSCFFYQHNSYTQQSFSLTWLCVLTTDCCDFSDTTHCSTNKSHWRVNVPTVTAHWETLFNFGWSLKIWAGLWTERSVTQTWRALPAEAGTRIWTTKHQINDSMMSNQDL